MSLNHVIVFVLSFLVGAIPFGYLAGRVVRGVDIRSLGSGNPGATNVFRQVGPAWGIAVLLLDAGKGALSVLLARSVLTGETEWPFLVAGLLAILGHSFSPFLAFRGGKGVATSAGVFFALAPASAAVALAVFLVAFLAGGMISLGSLLASLTLPPALWVLSPERRIFFYASLFVAILVWYRHRSNIGRILKGEEPRFMARRKED